MWTGKKPDVSTLLIFGSTVFVHVPAANSHKLDAKCVLCWYMGHFETTKGIRAWDPVERKIHVTRDYLTEKKANSKLKNSKVVMMLQSFFSAFVEHFFLLHRRMRNTGNYWTKALKSNQMCQKRFHPSWPVFFFFFFFIKLIYKLFYFLLDCTESVGSWHLDRSGRKPEFWRRHRN